MSSFKISNTMNTLKFYSTVTKSFHYRTLISSFCVSRRTSLEYRSPDKHKPNPCVLQHNTSATVVNACYLLRTFTIVINASYLLRTSTTVDNACYVLRTSMTVANACYACQHHDRRRPPDHGSRRPPDHGRRRPPDRERRPSGSPRTATFAWR